MITEAHEDTYIKGKVVTEKDGLLYTSIPYDKGWHVYVDGEELGSDEIIKVGQSLLAVNLKKGIHTVEFKFEAHGLNTGIFVTLTTALILLFIFLIKRMRAKRRKAPLLPCYEAIDSSFSEDVLIPEKIRIKTETENIRFIDISSNAKPKLPVREIIKAEKTLQREIISPPSKATDEE